MQIDSPCGRIFHLVKKSNHKPGIHPPKGAEPRAGQSGNIQTLFQQAKQPTLKQAVCTAVCAGAIYCPIGKLSNP